MEVLPELREKRRRKKAKGEVGGRGSTHWGLEGEGGRPEAGIKLPQRRWGGGTGREGRGVGRERKEVLNPGKTHLSPARF